MPEVVRSLEPEVNVYFVDASVDVFDLDECRGLLSDEERSRASLLVSSTDRDRRTVRFARRRQLLASYLGIDPFDVEITYDERGRPATSGDLRMSCSYAADVFVMALTHGHDIGVDVENIDSFSKELRLTRHLSEFEIQSIALMSEYDADWARARMWTRKEAFAKALGTGFSLDPRDIAVATTPRATSGTCRYVGNSQTWHSQDIDGWNRDLVATLVVATHDTSTSPSVSVRHFH